MFLVPTTAVCIIIYFSLYLIHVPYTDITLLLPLKGACRVIISSSESRWMVCTESVMCAIKRFIAVAFV